MQQENNILPSNTEVPAPATTTAPGASLGGAAAASRASKTRSYHRIDELNNDENIGLYPYLSRNFLKRGEQIKILNKVSKLNCENVTDTIKAINVDQLAKSVYDLKKINAIAPVVAKTKIYKELHSPTTDSVGSTIINASDYLRNFHEQSINTSEHQIKDFSEEIDHKKALTDSIPDRKYIDRSNTPNCPINTWSCKKIKNISSTYIDQLYTFNKTVSNNKYKNTTGSQFGSCHHIAAGAYDKKYEEFNQYTHHPYINMQTDILKLRQSSRKHIDTTIKILVKLSEVLTSPVLIEILGEDIKEFLSKIPKKIQEHKREETVNRTIKDAYSNSEEFYKNAQSECSTSPRNFIGTNIKSWSRKQLISNKQKDVIKTLKEITKFRFIISASYYYSLAAPIVPVEFATLRKRVDSDYYRVRNPGNNVDDTDNKFNYIKEHIEPHLYPNVKEQKDKEAQCDDADIGDSSSDNSGNTNRNQDINNAVLLFNEDPNLFQPAQTSSGNELI